jgi:hypothetical protein
LNYRTAEEQLASILIRRQGAYRVAAEGGILVEQSLLMRLLVQRADSFERPEGMDRTFAAVPEVTRFFSAGAASSLVVHDQALGVRLQNWLPLSSA